MLPLRVKTKKKGKKAYLEMGQEELARKQGSRIPGCKGSRVLISQPFT
jgi:hypothetical protein